MLSGGPSVVWLGANGSVASALVLGGSVALGLGLGLGLGLSGCGGSMESGDSGASTSATGIVAGAPADAGPREVPAHPLVETLPWRWLADGGPGKCALALDGENVYLADEWDGTIRRIPKGGGATTVLLDHQGNPRDLAVDGQNLFWSVLAVERLRRAPKGGGAFGGLAGGVSTPAHLALDETDVYFTRLAITAEDDAAVLRVPKGGGKVTVLAHAPPETRPTSLALDGDHVYFTVDGRRSSQGVVQRVAKAGGEVETLASQLDQPGSIAVDATDVFFIVARRDNQPSELVRLPKAGGAQVVLAKALGPGLALDATHVFFVGKEGVYRVAKVGGEARRLAELPRGSGEDLALDETALWACGSSGLYKLSWTPFSGPPQLLSGEGSSTKAFVFDGRGRLVGGAEAGHARANDVSTGQTGPEVGRGQRISDLGIAADGETLIVPDRDGSVEGWSLASGARTWANTPEKKPSSTEVFAVSPDGTLVLFRRGGDWMRLLDAGTGKEVRSFLERHEALNAAAIAPDNSFWLGATSQVRSWKAPKPSKEPPFRMWDMATGKPMGTFSGQPEWISAIAITRDGKRAVSVGDEGLFRVWDVASRALVASWSAPGASGVALSRSGERALTVSLAEGTCLWDLGAQKRIACVPPRPRLAHYYWAPDHVAFSPAEDEAWWSTDNGYLRWKLPE